MIITARTLTRTRAQHEREFSALAYDVREGFKPVAFAVRHLLQKDGPFGGAINIRRLALLTGKSEERWMRAVGDFRKDYGVNATPILRINHYGAGTLDNNTIETFVRVSIKDVIAMPGQYIVPKRCEGIIAVPFQDAIRRFCETQIAAYERGRDRVPAPDAGIVDYAFDVMGAANTARVNADDAIRQAAVLARRFSA